MDQPSRKSFILQKVRSVWQQVGVCKMIASQECKSGSNFLGQFDMQLRTSTAAIDYINTTRIQKKSDESKIKILHL